jgi:hypothetical protein
MTSSLARVKWEDLTEAVPAFITAVMMPFSFSITEGIALGFISYCVMKIGTGRFRELSPCVIIVALLFVLKIVFMMHIGCWWCQVALRLPDLLTSVGPVSASATGLFLSGLHPLNIIPKRGQLAREMVTRTLIHHFTRLRVDLVLNHAAHKFRLVITIHFQEHQDLTQVILAARAADGAH